MPIKIKQNGFKYKDSSGRYKDIDVITDAVYMTPKEVECNYVNNNYISEQQFINGFHYYKCSQLISVAYINISTSQAIPANTKINFAQISNGPIIKSVNNITGINGTRVQIIIETDGKVYLFAPLKINESDTYATNIFIVES